MTLLIYRAHVKWWAQIRHGSANVTPCTTWGLMIRYTNRPQIWIVHMVLMTYEWCMCCLSDEQKGASVQSHGTQNMRSCVSCRLRAFTGLHMYIYCICACVCTLYTHQNTFLCLQRRRADWWLTAICSHSKHEQRKKGPEILYRLLFLSLNWLIEQYKAK